MRSTVFELMREETSMVLRGMLWFAAAGFSLAALAQTTYTMAIPSDPFEVITAQTVIDAHPSRAAVLELLGRARSSFALRSVQRAYDLKVRFTVDSGGQTEYDGTWAMEDIFDPNRGFRWTASTSAGFAISGINANGMSYGEETGSYVPLRLHEARAALFDPMPSAANDAGASMRTAMVVFNGVQLNCVLISGAGKTRSATPGRRWGETEECIDPQSGLLKLHSQVPGRYYSYDYTNAPQIGGYMLPRRVSVIEAGKVVTDISVESLTEMPAADPGLFVPTAEMKAHGMPVAMGEAQKIFRVSGRGRFGPGATARVICVVGVMTPSGQLAEAHSLQPYDPNSEAAVEDAKQIRFPSLTIPGARPRQHFVFVIEQFPSLQ